MGARRKKETVVERRLRHAKYRQRHPLGNLLGRARRRAKTKGWRFNIEEKDLLPIPTHCPILGIKLDYTRNKLGNNSPSIDRRNSNLGYVKGNVRVISNRANQKKSDWTLPELERLVSYMNGEL